VAKGRSYIKSQLWLVAASLAIAVLLIAMIRTSVPSTLHFSSSEVSAQDVRFFQSAPYHQIRRPLTGEAENYLPDQFGVKQGGTRQFSFTRHHDDLSDQIQRIFIPVSGGDVSLSINGAPAARGQNLPYTGPGLGRQYLYAEINPSLLNPGINRIDLIMRQDRAHAGIRQIYFSDDPQLMTAETSLLAWSKRLKSILFIAGIMGLICSLFGLIIGYNRVVFIGGAGLGSVATIYGSKLNLLGFDQSAWLNHKVLAALSLVSAVLIIFGCIRSLNLSKLITLGSALAALFAASLGLLLTVSAVHMPSSTTVIHCANSALTPVLIFGLPLQLIFDMRLFRKSYAAAQYEITQQKNVIAAQDMALKTEIKNKAVLEERQRFTRDMHDGIGGQLMSLLARVRSGRVDLSGVESDLKSSLTDLRMVVDSLDNVGENLGAAMVTFHARASKQLEAEQVHLDWNQDFDLSEYILDTRRILNLYRLLQEAISNIARHAEASEVTIKFSDAPDKNGFAIQIADNGKGFDIGPKVAGKGLKNMKTRAKKIGGVLDIVSQKEKRGTTINLLVPIGT